MSEVPTTAAIAAGVESEDEQLQDAARLRSLARSGLGAHADPKMQAVTERVHRWLGVPIALVSLVESDRQVFPGMTGLPEPWATSRSAPLGHSYCRHVVIATEPLIVSDAREHPLLKDSPAVDELGAVAYAGMPLTDEAGNVLGSLCAIDVVPRQWTAAQLDLLRGLADACSTELRLRLSRFSARDERRRRDELEQRLRGSFDRSQALLAASEAFSDTVTVEDVRNRVSELVKTELRPSYVGLALLDDDGRLHRMRDISGFPAGSRTRDRGGPTTSSRRSRRPRRYGSGGSSPTTTGPASTPTIPNRLAGCSATSTCTRSSPSR